MNPNRSMPGLMLLLAVTATGCGHSVIKRDPAAGLAPDEVVVEMGKDDVSIGSQVSFFEQTCSEPHPGVFLTNRPNCRMQKVAQGEVVRMTQDDHAVVRTPAGSRVQPGMAVVKE